MKYTLSKFPNSEGKVVWQVLIPGSPVCHETDEQSASALARELLHKDKGNELFFWDYLLKKYTLMDRS